MGLKNDSMRIVLVDGLRKVLYIPVMIFRSLTNNGTKPNAPITTTGSPETRSGFLYQLIGWPPTMPDASRETAWLDGLRGIAAFLVMALHVNMYFFAMHVEAPYGSVLQPQNVATYALWRLPFIRFFFVSGHAQVSVFFVISGFVLSWSSLEHIRAGNTEKLLNTLSSAVARRWFRLYLPVFAAGLLAFFRVRLGLEKPPGLEIYSNIFRQAWDYLWACEAFARPVLRNREYPNWMHKYSWITWSIPLEFEGSLLVFVLLLSMARVKRYGLRVLIISVWAIYACVVAQWSYWLFAQGMLLADFIKEMGGFARLTQRTTGLYKLGCWLVFAVGFWMAGVPGTSSVYYNRPGYEFLDRFFPHTYYFIEGGNRFWWSLAGVLIVYSASGLQPVRRVCETRFSQYLGQISYMLYLTHSGFPLDVTTALVTRFRMAWGTPRWDPQYGRDIYDLALIPEIFMYCVTWTVMIVTAIPLAYWCYVLIDKSSVRVAKRIEMWFIGGGNGGNNGAAPTTQARDRRNDGDGHERVALLPI